MRSFPLRSTGAWIQAFGGLRKFQVRGTESVSVVHSFGEACGSGLHVIGYNLIRLGNLPKPMEVKAWAAETALSAVVGQKSGRQRDNIALTQGFSSNF